ncbi:MAG: SlyX protein [Woeseiaceae bacterium]
MVLAVLFFVDLYHGDIVDENKLIEIETKLAHQEHLLAELNEVLTSQQAQIVSLEGLCAALIDRVRALSETGSAAGDEAPPHY